jgi:tRNA acetyltransferase TAN1
MWYLLGEIGDRGSNIETTSVIGLVVAKTKLDPIKAVQDLRVLFRERPWEFKYALKVVPIQRVVPAQLSEIENGAVTIANEITEKEKFRVTVEKRHTVLSSRSVIDAVARRIDRVVNLESPDKILLVEIIGELAGLAVIRPNEILSVEKEKRIQ